MNKPLSSICFVLIIAVLYSCSRKSNTETRNEFGKYYDEHQVDGAMVIFDQKNDRYIYYNELLALTAFIPASSFKICNSLIGLETGVIKDENFIIAWDSIPRQNPSWNQDQDMKSAFRNSTVWYYQELARRVGSQKMKYWLDQAHYGNADISGGIDLFWLTGGLRITPKQQVDFLKRLHDDQLPFSKRNMDIVKKIMIADSTGDYILRGKTGWGNQEGLDIGWYTGYVETKSGTYYFANIIKTPYPDPETFMEARKEIVYEILRETGIIEGQNDHWSRYKIPRRFHFL